MKRIKLLVFFSIVLFKISIAQEQDLNLIESKGIKEFKLQNSLDTPNFHKVKALLDAEIKLSPKNPELRYYLGYTIDKLNSLDGKTMIMCNENLIKLSSSEIEKCIELSPKYLGETIVLDPYSKITSIWGSLAMKHLYAGNIKLAKDAFLEGAKRGGFANFYLEHYKQLLNSCDSNSILIIGGDLEFYSILYLQNILKIRTDIKVVDKDLLNTNWYCNYLTNRIDLNFGLNKREIENIDPANKWETEQIELKTNKNKIFFELKPSYLENYLLRSDILLLSIIKENIKNKKIYFDKSQNDNFYLSLTEYLIDEGLLYSLRETKFNFEYDKVEKLKNLVNYNCENLNVEEINNSKDALTLINSIREFFCANIQNLVSQKSYENANQMYKLMESKFPIDKYPIVGIEEKYELTKSKLK